MSKKNNTVDIEYVNEQKEEGKIWWTPDSTITKNRDVMFLIGSRGVGKTYGCKKWCIKRFLKYGEQFCYTRRYETELGNVNTLFNDLAYDPDFEGYSFRVYSTSDYHNCFWVRRPNSEVWEPMGFYIALSTSYQFKATSYPKVKYLIFDEFLYEKGSYARELKGELNQFFNLLETIFRLRDFRVFMLGNATTFETCYKYGLDLQEPFGSDIWYHKTKSILVEKIVNEKYIQAKRDSALGRLVEGTDYANYAIDNNFAYDSKSFIKKKKGNYRYIMGFYYKGKKFGIYTNYVQCVVDLTDKEPDYIIKDEDMDKDGIKLLQKKHPVIKYLSKYYNHGVMYYQNMEVKTYLHKLFMTLL